MKKRNIFLLAFFALFSGLIFSLLFSRYISDKEIASKENLTREFEKEMVAALDLKFVDRNNLYIGAHTRVINDTIMGYYPYITDESMPGFFFQSLNPLSVITFIEITHQENDPYPEGTYITYYKNGCMYFPEKHGSTIHKVCISGSTREYFREYRDSMRNTSKVYCYKNKAVLLGTDGVFVFDVNTEKILWKFPFKGIDAYEYAGPCTIINNKLYFTDLGNRVNCINLDNYKIEWQTQIPNIDLLPGFTPPKEIYYLYHTDKYLVLAGTKKLTMLDSNSGQIIWNFPWELDPTNRYQPNFDVVGDLVYFTYPDELKCMNYITNKIVWKLNNVSYQGIFKNNIVALSKDRNYFFVINKDTGKFKAKIKNPDDGSNLIDFIDNKYIIINSRAIYK